jgi:hypothetical protein
MGCVWKQQLLAFLAFTECKDWVKRHEGGSKLFKPEDSRPKFCATGNFALVIVIRLDRNFRKFSDGTFSSTLVYR